MSNLISNKHILIGVMTCPKFAHRAEACRQTWAKALPENVNLVFVESRPGELERQEEDRLYLDCVEAYENLPEKVFRFYRYCQNHFEFDYVLKLDDDSYLDVHAFLNFDTQGKDYIGLFKGMGDPELTRTWHYGKCSDKSLEVPYETKFVCEWARGGGYLLSIRAVRKIARLGSSVFENQLFEDKMVGEALADEKSIQRLKAHYTEMGILNPMSPHNMRYLHQNISALSRGAIHEISSKAVDFGSFNRVDPISQKWGFDRGSPIDRYYIESFLEKNAEYVRGRVLEIKDDNYTKQFGSEKVTASEILDIDSKNERATLIADITDRSALTANQFDCVIFTQTLQLLPDPEEAIRNLHYILKPGGSLLVTCPGISKIQTTGPESEWFFFFTPLSLNMMLLKVFDEKNIEVHSQGNVFSATAFLWGLALSDVDINHLDINDPNYPLLLSVKATKQ